MPVYGHNRIKEISENLCLPSWWVQSVIVEYFDCRRYAENNELWLFDFNILKNEDIELIPEKKVVVPEFCLIQNIRPKDFSQRLILLNTGLPIIPLDEANLIPEGIANDSAFPSPIRNDISIWDPKLGFDIYAIVRKNDIFYQWIIAEPYNVPGKHYRWYKSELTDLTELFNINEKLRTYRSSAKLTNPSAELVNEISQDYQILEEIRAPIREKILEYHHKHEGNYDKSLAKVPEVPMLSIFEAIRPVKNENSGKATKEGYFIKTTWSHYSYVQQ